MHQVPGRINQLRDLIRSKYGRQLSGTLGERNLIEQAGAPKVLDEEKPQRRASALDGARRHLPVAKQMHLVLTNVAGSKALRRAVEVFREIRHRVDVVTDSAWGIVATREFIKHQLPG